MTDTTPSAVFKVSGNATIKHLNVRKEGPEDDKILAVDVKFEIKKVDRRICDYFDAALQAFLWRGETDALIVRNDFLVPIAYGNEVSGAVVKIGSETYMGCDVKKFALQPQDGGVLILTCSVAVYPSSNDVAKLAKLVQEDTKVSIEGPPDLFAPQSMVSDKTVDAFSGLAALDVVVVGVGDNIVDDLLPEALACIKAAKKASISLVQRHLKIGYNRAATILEQLEKRGAVSPMGAAGQREILA